jgi:hypothetical protein
VDQKGNGMYNRTNDSKKGFGMIILVIKPNREIQLHIVGNSKLHFCFLTMYLAAMKGSVTDTTSISSLLVAIRRTSLPIRPNPAIRNKRVILELKT